MIIKLYRPNLKDYVWTLELFGHYFCFGKYMCEVGNEIKDKKYVNYKKYNFLGFKWKEYYA